MSTTFDRLKPMLVKEYKLDPDVVTMDAPLDTLGIDSLGLAELLFDIEDEFGVALPSEPVPLATVGDVVRFLDGLMAARPTTTVEAPAP